MVKISSGIRAHFEALILVLVCTFGCLWMELVNTFTVLFQKEKPYPRVSPNIWEHWDWIAKRYAQGYVKPYGLIHEVFHLRGENIKHIRAVLECRADSIRHTFETRAKKWWRINIPAISYEQGREQIRYFSGDRYYSLDRDLAAEFRKLESFLAFRTKILHEDWIECFGSMTKGRRENSVMSAELMTCAGVVLIKFGSVVKGVVPLEHLERMGCAHIQSVVFDTIRQDSGYEYMCEKLKDYKAKFKV